MNANNITPNIVLSTKYKEVYFVFAVAVALSVLELLLLFAVVLEDLLLLLVLDAAVLELLVVLSAFFDLLVELPPFRYFLMSSNVFFPIPFTLIRSSIDLNFPFFLR